MAMFELSMDRFHHVYHRYFEPRYIKIRWYYLDRVEKALAVIKLVEDLLNRPPEYDPENHFITHQSVGVTRDAVTAVLFNVYGNPSALQLNAYRGLRLGNTKLDTVDIITQ
ncbi:hypothetical protein NEOLI_005397 [Neolecta irregularis DAH-3]|uniref:Uncharacterized protein n=1 Tax=Neolecta irregularis (strain DAH-3) TaxID=1198029 RepID=A0A1U7LL00_NEOID|nr:hypothetical protein NEOLI_005397 [Neolecta irregularis DAH-3]|eukprot:OLL23327.1 hypothetical protein NEOLI_005397 [Neolecta irregularis DAH-3]